MAANAVVVEREGVATKTCIPQGLGARDAGQVVGDFNPIEWCLKDEPTG